MKFALILSATALCLASAAFAQEIAEEARPSKDETLQCRFQKKTGSRTKAYRICLTKSEWRKRAVEEQEELERLRGNTTHTLYVARTS